MANTEDRIRDIVSELHSYLQSWIIKKDLPKFNRLINRLNKAVFIYNGEAVKLREGCPYCNSKRIGKLRVLHCCYDCHGTWTIE